MDIQILGPSCANCLRLEMLTMETLTELGVHDARIQKIAVPREMEKLMTSSPPGPVVNG